MRIGVLLSSASLIIDRILISGRGPARFGGAAFPVTVHVRGWPSAGAPEQSSLWKE
jgi:hypothetical protein